MILSFTEELYIIIKGYSRGNNVYIPNEIINIIKKYRLINNIIKFSTSNDVSNKYENITINKNVILTCKPWVNSNNASNNSNNSNNGILIITTNKLINNGSIDCSGNGFYNKHGYGFGKKDQRVTHLVAGGSYGTTGQQCDRFGIIGDIYGWKTLQVIYHGSGCHSNKSSYGVGGGGIIIIYCMEFINNGTVHCDGKHGGSGGSILIIAKSYVNNMAITSKGAKESEYNGAGGNGRIAIYSDNINDSNTSNYNPKPYIGSFKDGSILIQQILSNKRQYINPKPISVELELVIPSDNDYAHETLSISQNIGVKIEMNSRCTDGEARLCGIRIQGSKYQCRIAQSKIHQLWNEWTLCLPQITFKNNPNSVNIEIPQHSVGSVVGKFGKTLKRLQKVTKCDIIIHNDFKSIKPNHVVITLDGNPSNIDLSRLIICTIIYNHKELTSKDNQQTYSHQTRYHKPYKPRNQRYKQHRRPKYHNRIRSNKNGFYRPPPRNNV